MDDDRPPAAENCDYDDTCEPNTTPAMGAPASVAPDLEVVASKDDEAAATAAPAATADATLGALPDEVLEVVFNFCDDRTLMMTIPAVSRRWLGVCQMRPATIDLTWARTVHGRRCAITDVGPPGWCAGSLSFGALVSAGARA